MKRDQRGGDPKAGSGARAPRGEHAPRGAPRGEPAGLTRRDLLATGWSGIVGTLLFGAGVAAGCGKNDGYADWTNAHAPGGPVNYPDGSWVNYADGSHQQDAGRPRDGGTWSNSYGDGSWGNSYGDSWSNGYADWSNGYGDYGDYADYADYDDWSNSYADYADYLDYGDYGDYGDYDDYGDWYNSGMRRRG